MSWKPKSEGNDGEVGAMKAFQDAGIKFSWQVVVKTRGYPWPYKCDFIFKDREQPWITAPEGKVIVGENQGGFHYRTKTGKPAIHQRNKDGSKQFNLTQEGYVYVEWKEQEIVTRRYRKGVKTLDIHPDVVLDRLLQAFEAPAGTAFTAPEELAR